MKPVITTLGHFLPDHVLSNEFMDSLDIGSNSQWIEDRIGIRNRRSILPPETIAQLRRGETNLKTLKAEGRVMEMSEMLARAGDLAASRKPDFRFVESELFLAASSTPDYDVPANACKVAARLGAATATTFDVNSACSSFVVGVATATGLMTQNGYKKSVVSVADRFTTRVDFSDRKNCILFGDSAALAVIENDPKARGLEVIDSVIVSNPVKWSAVVMAQGDFFDQDGAAVQKFAISKTIEVTQTILDRNQLAAKDIAYFIGHQANFRMLSYVERHFGFSPSQHLHNVIDVGNQGCSGAPTVLSQNWDRFKSGDYVVMSVVGAGLTWASLLLRCR